MEALKGFQRKYLRGVAHGMKPVVLIGQKGVTDAVRKEVDNALEAHELIKVKFIDHKEKEQKMEILAHLTRQAECEMVGLIGHTAILYRQQPDPQKQKIVLPKR